MKIDYGMINVLIIWLAAAAMIVSLVSIGRESDLVNSIVVTDTVKNTTIDYSIDQDSTIELTTGALIVSEGDDSINITSQEIHFKNGNTVESRIKVDNEQLELYPGNQTTSGVVVTTDGLKHKSDHLILGGSDEDKHVKIGGSGTVQAESGDLILEGSSVVSAVKIGGNGILEGEDGNLILKGSGTSNSVQIGGNNTIQGTGNLNIKGGSDTANVDIQSLLNLKTLKIADLPRDTNTPSYSLAMLSDPGQNESPLVYRHPSNSDGNALWKYIGSNSEVTTPS